MSVELMMSSNHLILIPFFSCLQSFPASGSFPVSQLFKLTGQTIRASASASVLPTNLQGWFLLGLTGWISLLSKGLPRVFSLRKIMHVKSWAQFLAYRESLIFKAFDPALPNPSLSPFSNSGKSALLTASKEEQGPLPQSQRRSLQCLRAQLLRLTLCDPMDSSLSASSVHGIFQARIWSGFSFPPPGDLPEPGTEPMSPASLALEGRFFYHWATREEIVVSKERELGSRGGETAEPSKLFENIIFSFMNFSQV